MAMTQYGDISPRTAGHASRELLKRGIALRVFQKFGQMKPIPRNSTDTIIFRRYEALDPTPKALVEGVTPASTQVTHTDIQAALTQYGDWVELTDVIQDTHEDPVLSEMIELLSEQAPEMLEIVLYHILRGGTNIFYANGTSRSDVNSAITLSKQRSVTRGLKRQRAKKITKALKSTPDFGTEAVAPAFIGIAHSDLESDIRDLPGFVPTEKYGSMTPYEAEIGKVEDVRYLTTSIPEPWEDAGGDPATNSMLSTSGSSTDVYPVLYFSQNAYGVTPLAGKRAVTPMVLNPNTPRGGDPMGQRGSVAWKSYLTAAILQDLWMARLEVGAADLD